MFRRANSRSSLELVRGVCRVNAGAASVAMLDSPRDVAATRDGRTTYIADTGNGRVRRVDRTASFARSPVRSSRPTWVISRVRPRRSALAWIEPLRGYLVAGDERTRVSRRPCVEDRRLGRRRAVDGRRQDPWRRASRGSPSPRRSAPARRCFGHCVRSRRRHRLPLGARAAGFARFISSILENRPPDDRDLDVRGDIERRERV